MAAENVQLNRPPSPASRLAVCTWSLRPPSPERLVEQLQSIGATRVQLALDPLSKLPELWGGAAGKLAAHGIEIVSGMFGCVGEDYSTMETIRVTGGIAPDATWPENWDRVQKTAALAKQLNLKLVTFHAGFLPEREDDPQVAILQQRLREVADLFARHEIALGLETGQETAVVLARFLQRLDRPNLGVNFDPANMILYDKGNPIEALRILSPWLRQVHLKDGLRTKVPGTWGKEVVVGTGEVDWREFFAILDRIGFSGNLCIEREAGEYCLRDIQTAMKFVQSLQ